MSLRNKLTLVIIALLTLGLIVAGIGTTLLLRPTLVDQMDSQLRSAAAEPETVIGGSATTNRFGFENVRSAPRPYYVALLTDTGTVLVDNWGDEPRALAPDVSELAVLAQDPVDTGEEIITLHDAVGGSWRGIPVPVESTSGQQLSGQLVMALPMSNVNATMASFLAIFLGFGISVVIFGAALTRLLVSATLQPLRRVESTAMSFAAGDFDARLPGATPNTEVGRLSRALNAMLGRIDTALEERDRTIERMRRFIGDASHELRTPLVTVRGYGELYRMGALDEEEKVALAMDRIESEAKRMTALVEGLLQLARLDESTAAERELLDLESLVEDAAMDAHASAPDRPVQVLPVRVIFGDEFAQAPQQPKKGTGSHLATLDASPDAPTTVLVGGKRLEIPEELLIDQAERDRRGAAVSDILATQSFAIISPEEAERDRREKDEKAKSFRSKSADHAVSNARRFRWRSKKVADAASAPAAPVEASKSASRNTMDGRGTGSAGATAVAPRSRKLLRSRRAQSAPTPAPAPNVAPSTPGDAPIPQELVEIPAMIHGEQNKVRQCIQNIVGNAMRYSPDGSPLELGVVIDPARREASVEIIDHGEGVPEQIREKIFERFWRADTSRARETGGSGLGLAIVVAIMKSHGGKVDVVDTPGGGATFRLIFPLLLAEDVENELSTVLQRKSAGNTADA